MLLSKRVRLSLVKIALVFISGSSLAGEGDVSPGTPFDDGLWEITIFKELTNMPFPPRPLVDKQCLTNRDIAEGRIPLHVMRDCNVVPGRFQGEELDLKITCGVNGNAFINGALQFKRTTFKGKVEIRARTENGPGEGLRITYDAKRIGPCGKE